MKLAGSNVAHNIDPIIYSSRSSYKAIDKIIPYVGLGHCQIAKMGLFYLSGSRNGFGIDRGPRSL